MMFFPFKLHRQTMAGLLLGCFFWFFATAPKAFAEEAEAARIRSRLNALPMSSKVNLSNQEWRKVLTPAEFYVLRAAGTERPFKNAYWNNHQKGIYLCAACRNKLFGSDTKFESHSGWPSFYGPLAADKIAVGPVTVSGMLLDEVTCARCGSHLGHVFYDGPPPTHLRYCINSLALKFVNASER